MLRRYNRSMLPPYTCSMLHPCRAVAEIVEHQNAVYMIGHDHEFVDRNSREMIQNRVPSRIDGGTGLVQTHRPIDHVAKQQRPIASADRHEVGACLSVVVPGKANRSTIPAASGTDISKRRHTAASTPSPVRQIHAGSGLPRCSTPPRDGSSRRRPP